MPAAWEHAATNSGEEKAAHAKGATCIKVDDKHSVLLSRSKALTEGWNSRAWHAANLLELRVTPRDSARYTADISIRLALDYLQSEVIKSFTA